MAAFRGFYGGGGEDGHPATNPTGPVNGIDVLYVCGGNDGYILCDHSYAQETEGYVVGGDYVSVVVECGHSVLDVGDCKSEGERDKVINAIMERVGAK